MSVSAKVVLYTSKTLSGGEHPILLRVIKNRQQLKVGLGINCPSDLWDAKNNRPKRKHPLYQEIKVRIDKAELEAERFILSFQNEGRDFSLEELREKLLAEPRKRTTVYTYFEEVVERLRASDRIGTADIFHATKKSLMAFRDGKDFQFSDVTHGFLTRWEEFFLLKGTKPNSFFVYYRTFKTLINYAKRDGTVKDDYNPYRDVSFAKYRRIQTHRRAIPRDDIARIEALSPKEGTGEFHARNYFLFSFYNRGINLVDIAYLKWTDLPNGRLIYERRKTKELFNMKIMQPAQAILDYYRLNVYRGEDQYVFPILSDFHQTEKQRRARIQKITGNVNRNLKLLAHQAGIAQDLTFYVGRHTMANTLKKAGVPIAKISEIMGHDSEATTRIYLKSFENEELDEASRALL